MAIITRCCWPPDISCGYEFIRSAGWGCQLRSSALQRAQACLELRLVCRRSISAICSPQVNTGFKEVIGPENHRNGPAANLAHVRFGHLEKIGAFEQHFGYPAKRWPVPLAAGE